MSAEQVERVARIIDAVGWSDHDRLKRAGGSPEVLDALIRGSLHTARAVIAAIHPTVSTVDDADQLPAGSVILDRNASIGEYRGEGYWVAVGVSATLPALTFDYPATVLHVGGAA